MKKTSYLFVVLLIAGALMARPAHAQTYTNDIRALLESLIKQVQELQRQLAIIQAGNDEEIGTTNDSGGIIPIKHLRLLSPNGGETLITGEDYPIRWSWKGPGVADAIALWLVDDQGRQAAKPIVAATKNDGTYLWNISEAAGGEHKIYITTTDNVPAAQDYSDGYFKIAANDQDDEDVKESIEVLSPEQGSAYKAGQAIPLAFTVNSSDGKPDIGINLYRKEADKERIVNQVVYKYEDGFVKNGDNKIAFYPAKGSDYDTEGLTGTFRIEVIVGEVMCCKYWVEPGDADITGWFTIGLIK